MSSTSGTARRRASRRNAAGAGEPTGGARAATARRRALRRRRLKAGVLALLAIGALTVAVVAALPLIRHVESEFGLPLQYPAIIRRQAAAEHLDPALVAAVIYAETKFDSRRSPTGAEGLMQIEPRTARFLARASGGARFTASDLWKPAVNIAYGSYYLRYLLDRFGSLPLALAAYNAGETNVDSWVAKARRRHAVLRISGIPFPETRAYVERVLQAREDYRSTYSEQLGYSSHH
jgi:soluble lytic murein transglycosylase